MRLSSVQLKMAGELWSGYLQHNDQLQKEQQHVADAHNWVRLCRAT